MPVSQGKDLGDSAGSATVKNPASQVTYIPKHWTSSSSVKWELYLIGFQYGLKDILQAIELICTKTLVNVTQCYLSYWSLVP